MKVVRVSISAIYCIPYLRSLNHKTVVVGYLWEQVTCRSVAIVTPIRFVN